MTSIGIDFGLSYSVVAVPDGRVARVLPNREAELRTPCVVGLRRQGRSEPIDKIVIGRDALNNWPMAAKDTIFAVQRIIGKDALDPDVLRVCHCTQCEIVATDNLEEGIRLRMGARDYAPTEIASFILCKLLEDSEWRLGKVVSGAVITVPAYFTQKQRDATQKAALEAGFQAIRLVDKPTAIAVAFGLGFGSKPMKVLVYDLEEDSFDVAVLIIASKTIGVVNIQGDTWLGERQLTQPLIELAAQYVRTAYGVDPYGNECFIAELQRSSHRVAAELGTRQSADLVISGILRDGAGDLLDVELTVRREEYTKMIQPTVDRTLELSIKAVQESGLDLAEMDAVCLSGAGTQNSVVYESLERLFSLQTVMRDLNPLTCGAQGAALIARSL